ncbi:MAG: hypothetical protein Q8O92_12410 [Candidatus Latescibacter sp.]|nr:hypothetical protein [Candidatus Latescibacter sp.]
MPKISEINTAVFRLLEEDETLAVMCTVLKGAKRPARAKNPTITVDTKRLEPGEGEGIWMCDVTVTAYADNLSNGTADQGKLEDISARVKEILADSEIELENGKALPLIEGESHGSEWSSYHENEAAQENIFGLVFVSFT